MILRLVKKLYRIWYASPLGTKIVAPMTGLMIASLLLSTVAFVAGTARTQSELLEQELSVALDQVASTLAQRTQTVSQGAAMLAGDELLVENVNRHDADALQTVNQRAVVVRERLDLDLVQVYDASDVMRANLLVSSLYRQSSLLDLISSGTAGIRVIGGRMLFLSRVALDEGRGSVVTGIDLENELLRLTQQHRLWADAGLVSRGLRIRTVDDLPFEQVRDAHATHYVLSRDIKLGETYAQLYVGRETVDMRRVTSAGLSIMVVSSLLTTALLVGLAVLFTRVVVRPVHRLASVAQRLANGDMNQSDKLSFLSTTGDPATQDEIILLARAFRHMVGELRDLYSDLEGKVEERTRELADAEERYRRFFEDDLAGAFVCDGEGRILTCNPAFLRIFCFASAEDANSSSLCDLYPDVEDWHALRRLLHHKGELEYYEAELRSVTGEPVHVIENVIATVEQDGRLSAIKGYIFDNSERKRLEEELRQAQKMEAIGRLAGGVAHDFNNLLTVILGYTQILLTKATTRPETSLAESKRELTLVRNAGEQAADLTGQLLAFSRKQMLQPQVLCLNCVVENMGALLCRVIGEDVHLVTNLDPDLGHVSADPSQIQQVVMNLAVNARDAMPRGGRLTIETGNVRSNGDAHRASDLPNGRFVTLCISDTGVGMDKETQTRIFEPFFTTKEEGTGLGLSTVYGIIKQSSGHIDVQSDVGKGTLFTVYLPRVDAPVEPDESRWKPGPVARASGTILLVEDEALVRGFAGRALRDAGYGVIEAVDGRDALTQIRDLDGRVDLVLTDMVMPEMGGAELAATLRREYPGLAVLFMSGYTDNRFLDDGVVGHDTVFIRKPFEPDVLAHHVHQALAQKVS